MTLGGIPHYLNELEAGKSTVQNIDDICFSEGGPLKDEFNRLYPALFENAENHIAIIRALATKWKGLTRKEMLSISGITEGGGATRVIHELIHSGFSSFYSQSTPNQKGLQIDLLLDRNDHVINLFELKIYYSSYSITQKYAMELREKMARFQELTATQKQIFLTIISPFGLNQNEHSLGLVDNDLNMNDLFDH